MMRAMLTFVALLAAVYGALAAAMYFGQERLLFLPDVPERAVTITPAAVGFAYEEPEIVTADGERLGAWFIPAAQPRGAVIHFHGNAGNIAHRLDYAEIFGALGYDLLLFDYRGYGTSSGRPTEAGTYRDAAAAWRYLTVTRGIAPERIVLHGQSLGGAVAAALAAEVRPAALILESSFTSVADAGAEIYPWLPVRWLARIRYDTAERLARVSCPVLVIHSRHDEIVGFAHGEKLFAAAREPKRLLEIAGDHNGALVHSRDAYIHGLQAFLGSLPQK